MPHISKVKAISTIFFNKKLGTVHKQNRNFDSGRHHLLNKITIPTHSNPQSCQNKIIFELTFDHNGIEIIVNE